MTTITMREAEDLAWKHDSVCVDPQARTVTALDYGLGAYLGQPGLVPALRVTAKYRLED